MGVALSDAQLAQLKSLFEDALTLPSSERESFIRTASGGDALLESELESLLQAHEASDGYFETLAQTVIVPALSEIDRERGESGRVHRVSHYDVVERIGGGGMGVIYKAKDTRLGRTVALKFLPRHHASNPAARARLMSEARAASRLDHPNIGTIHEIAEAEDGAQFITMAWYDGETLRDRIRRGPLAVSETIDIATQLTSALAAAHNAGIVHRDVKPANVIITRSGLVKLVDFGVAKLLSEDEGEKSLAAGTVAYMSPEQTRHEGLDARTDIWSLGVVAYEMLCGQRPFDGETDADLIRSIRSDDSRRITDLRPDAPLPLARSIERCLQKNPEHRYQSAEQLSDALTNAAREDRRATHAPAGTRMLAIAAIAVMAVAGTYGYSRLASDTQDRPGASPARLASVAVLPFTDPDASDSSNYLAEGLADDLRRRLGAASDLVVPDYLSSRPYSGSSKSLSQVAKEMNANYLVTGRIERSGRTPGLQLWLTDPADRSALWSATFELDTASTRAAVGSAATTVLAKIGSTIPAPMRERIGRPLTPSARAYDLYLRGRYAELSGTPRTSVGTMSEENIGLAQALYVQARSLDPGFARARARLALSHIFSAGTYDTTQARREQARLEAEAALRLDSLLPEAHEALAAYWTRAGNAARAVEVLERGLRLTPNDVGSMLVLAQAYLMAGRADDAHPLLDRAMRLDPRNPLAAWRAAMTYGRHGRKAEAMKALDRVMEISPDDHEVRLIQGHGYIRWKGSTEYLDAALQKIPADWDTRGMATYARYTVFRIEGRYREALAILGKSEGVISRDGLVYYPASLMLADIHAALGENADARRFYQRAIGALSDSSAAHPEDASIHAALGLAYAGLGRKTAAIREAERAMDIASRARNGVGSTAYMGLAVETFARVGEIDRAVKLIELLLSMPSGREASLAYLRIWPGFDPLRKDRRFNELLDRYTAR